jgi:hypothetical protein
VAGDLAALTELQTQFNALDNVEAINALLLPEIEQRQAGIDPDDDLVLQALLVVQPILETGDVAAFRAGLETAVQDVQTEVADAQASAEARRLDVENTQARLEAAEQALFDAQGMLSELSAPIDYIRNQTIISLIPYMLLAWVAALIGAAVVWVIVRLLASIVEPSTAINILMLALVAAIILGLGYMTLQYRLQTTGTGCLAWRWRSRQAACRLRSGISKATSIPSRKTWKKRR